MGVIAAALSVSAVGCDGQMDRPGGDVVGELKVDSSGPLLLVNDSVIYPSQRDSVLRSLRGAMLDSVFLLPGNTASTFARYGSRGASGVVLIYSRSP